MALLFTICIGVLLLCFGLYLRAESRNKKLSRVLQAAEAKLTALKGSDEALRREITVLQDKSREMLEDPLTHGLGRRIFEDRLNQSIKESARYRLTLGILYVDLDDFKEINEALGYAVGDELLKQVSQRLQACIRQVDSMTRFEKDTFVILLAQLAKPETAAIIAQRILQSLSGPFQIGQQELYVTACVGISIYPSDSEEASVLLRNADQAMRAAKAKGKQLYQFYQEKTHIKSERELMLYMNLNRDTILQEFTLYYQPIMNVNNETIMCMDVLLHWQHPEFGLVAPQEIFNYAEKHRKLNVLSEWLLQNACKQFLRWRTLGFAPQYLGIPLSFKQLENTPFIYNISRILQELNFEPAWLMLQIKENIETVPLENIEKSLNMLQYLGVRIAIDNFGSAAFSLLDLKRVTAHYLKLSKSIIEDIGSNPQTVELIKSIMFLASTMHMQTIVSGVETEQQLTVLKELGCLYLEGNLLREPLAEEEIEKMITHASI